MNKHKRLPLFWAAFSLLLLFTVNPALAAQSTEKPVDVDTLFNCTWSVGTVYPITILDAPAATSGSNIYVFGGVSSSITAASNKFDGTTWTPIAPLPVALEYAAAVTDPSTGLIYILGGAEPTAGTPQTTVNRYDPVANTYTARAPFVTGVWNAACVYNAGKIYKIAGTGPATASTNVVEIYDVAANTWVAGPAYPLSISFVSAWSNGNFIYAAGGIQSVGSLASAKTYRLDVNNLGAGWDDAAIADLPATRWGAASAVYQGDLLMTGGYVAGSATANISATAISYDIAGNTWGSIPNMAGAPSGTSERSRFTGAVLGASFYAIGGRSIASAAFVGTNSNQKLTCLNTPTNIITNGGSMIISAGGNGVLDPGETVTVALGIQNSGGPGVVCTTAATTGTLQATGGVTNPSAPQNYGAVCSPPSPVLRNFTFTVDPLTPCGATVTATLQVQDGATNYGNLTYTFVTGTSAVSFTQNFDSVVAPALPPGWTSTATGIGVPWVTSTTNPASAPNDAFAPDPSNIADMFLVTPSFSVPAGGSTLSFKINYITEPGFDGAVLEFSTDSGATWLDITTGGNAFISGGYTSAISTAFASPISGRQAWNGTNPGSPAYITSSINMPAATLGQANVLLRWRMACDNSVAATGVRVDDISIANPVCESGPLVSAASRLNHTGVGDFDIALPLLPMGVTAGAGIECRRGGGAGQDTYIIVANFASATTPAMISALTVDCGSVGAPVQGANPNQLLFTVSGACYNTTAPPQYSGIHFTVAGVQVWITWGHCLGDTNASTGVNSGDTTQTKGRSGLTVDAVTFRSDVNTDGQLNSGDTTFVKARSGQALP